MCKVHKFIKFDEDRIFCERCGLFMFAARQAPVYVPDWTYRPYPPPTWPRWDWMPTVTAPHTGPFVLHWNDTAGAAAPSTTELVTIGHTAGAATPFVPSVTAGH